MENTNPNNNRCTWIISTGALYSTINSESYCNPYLSKIHLANAM